MRGWTHCSSLFTGLVSYWKLDETSGTRVDSVTATGNNLTAVNSPGYAAGVQGNATFFNIASLQCLSIADNATLKTGDADFTFCAWAYLSNNVQNYTILSKYQVTGNQREYSLVYNSSANRFRWIVSSTGANNITIDANNLGAPALNTWYFIVCWHDSVNNQIAIQVNNGTPNTLSWSGGVFVGTSNFLIGARDGPADYWTGRIDEVLFSKRVYASDERTALYNSGSGTTHPFIGAAV